MKYFFHIFSIILFILPQVQAEDYFIRLTKSGLLHKQAFLNPKVASIANMQRPPKIAIRKTIRHSRVAAQFERWLQISSDSAGTKDFIDNLKSQNLIDYAEPVGVFRINQAFTTSSERTTKDESLPRSDPPLTPPKRGIRSMTFSPSLLSQGRGRGMGKKHFHINQANVKVAQLGERRQETSDASEASDGFNASDTLLAKQWYLDKIQAPKAWDITLGSADIIVGIIDTGIDYTHPNLQGSFWVNESEANGISGFDDDGNGFVDDSLGWDFTDAPRFADGGDYKDPDNDPMDEYGSGHGTQVAGIIAARRNNEQGISGAAPGVRLMNLRAGTASGYLEEDDVARAIIYALDNGARIINMSFGDVVLSRFLRDVIYYAYQQGMVMVSSSGNSGDDQTHYPSALKETISVGATDENDYVAGFSTYGPSVDLVAPGANMFSTAVGGGYNEVNGTSFSAPVVSAVAGLILSLNPAYSVEQVRNVLKTSGKDIYYTGWDQYSAAGRVDALQAVRVQNSGVLQLTSPEPYASTAADTLWLEGSVIHPDLLAFSVAFGIGSAPENWHTVREYQRRQVYKDTLAAISLTGLPDTLITIRLQMRLVNDISDEIRRVVAIDHSPPKISNLQILPMYDGFLNSRLISFDSDDVCSAKLFLRQQGASGFSEILESSYETKTQRFKIDSDQFNGALQFYIEALNYSGLHTRDNNGGEFYSFELESDFEWQDFVQLDWKLPGGYFLDKALDLDADGNKEILLSVYDDDWNFGPLCIYEFNGAHFEKQLETAFTAIPRNAGDVDGDGKSDMLLGYGNKSFLFEATDNQSFPSEQVWLDTTGFWAAGYADLDMDGKGEIIGRVDSNYVILEKTADNHFTEIARLQNPSEGNNQYGVPKIQLADINNDGHRDLIFGDSDGDILVYSSFADNSFYLLATARANLQDATAMLTAVHPPYSNGLFVASHTADVLANENEFDARRWSIERFNYIQETEKLVSQDTINLYGYRSLRDFDSGIKVAWFNDCNYLFIACYPNLHIFKVEKEQISPVWHRDNIRSNAILIDDFDADGQPEFFVNSGREIIAYAKSKADRPPAPYPFSAGVLDSQRVLLKWGSVSGVQSYALYRGASADSLTRHALLGHTSYTDTCQFFGKMYYYAVTAIDSSYSQTESAYSKIDSARTSLPPRLVSLQVVSDRQIILQFNEAVQLFNQQPYKITLNQNRQQATSALILKSQHKILCGFSESFWPGIKDTLFINGVFDLDGVPIDEQYHSLTFVYDEAPKEPYIKEVNLPDRYTVLLTFNEPMLKSSLLNTDNYRLSPSGEVLEALLPDSILRDVELHLSGESMGGALGKPVYLELENIRNMHGVLLKNTGKINLFKARQNLDQLRIYPQPVRPGQRELIFANLPKNVEIHIFNLQGKLIKKMNQKTNFGGVRWDLRDDLGKKVRSGIYLYRITDHKQEKTGKLVIIR